MKIIKILLIFLGVNVVIHSTAGLATLLGLIPFPVIGFFFLIPFLGIMLLLTSIMMGCNIIEWLKRFYGFFIVLFLCDGIINSIKAFVGYGYIVAFVGLPLTTELVGWIHVMVLLIIKYLDNSLVIDSELFD